MAANAGWMSDLVTRITVAMITRNEEAAVGKVIRDIQNTIPGVDILIVDSSSDKTAEIALSLGARVIKQFPPRGYGAAMDLALHSSDRAVIVTLDCDDTYPVEFIEPMARLVLCDGYDLVDGSRLAGKPAAMPWVNFIANWTFGLLATVLFGQRIRDLHSGMRAYRRELIGSLHYETSGAALPVELLLRPLKAEIQTQGCDDSISAAYWRKYDAAAAKCMVDAEAYIREPVCMTGEVRLFDGITGNVS